jgi:hypothetical protein
MPVSQTMPQGLEDQEWKTYERNGERTGLSMATLHRDRLGRRQLNAHHIPNNQEMTARPNSGVSECLPD